MKKIFLIAFLLLFLATQAGAATYYVRTDGHDTNCNGTTDAAAAAAPNCAWLTIGKAESSISGTNTVVVANGNYTEDLTIDADGTDGSNLLTFQAQNNRLAVIKGIVSISGDYVKFDGFKILKQNGQTNTLAISGSYVTAVNNYLDLESEWTPPANTNYHFSVTGSNCTITDNYTNDGCICASIDGNSNTFADNELDHPKDYDPSCGDTDYVRIFGTGHTVRGNYLHGIILAEVGDAHSDGFQSFDNGGQIIKNCVFEDNIIHSLNSCFILSMTVNESVENTGNVIRNNACYIEGNWGLDIRFVSAEVYNNTIVIAGSAYFIGAIEYGEHTVKVKNNIFVATAAGAVATDPYLCSNGTQGTDCRNNIVYAVNSGTKWSLTGDVARIDPKLNSLTDPTLFTLQSDSPAIGAGVDLSATGLSDDIEGTARGAAWDIGAYEYEAGAVTGNISGATASGVTIQ